jgi:hypothetical protein
MFMTSPDTYCSLENNAAEANGNRVVAIVENFIFATKYTQNVWMLHCKGPGSVVPLYHPES